MPAPVYVETGRPCFPQHQETRNPWRLLWWILEVTWRRSWRNWNPMVSLANESSSLMDIWSLGTKFEKNKRDEDGFVFLVQLEKLKHYCNSNVDSGTLSWGMLSLKVHDNFMFYEHILSCFHCFSNQYLFIPLICFWIYVTRLCLFRCVCFTYVFSHLLYPLQPPPNQTVLPLYKDIFDLLHIPYDAIFSNRHLVLWDR